MHNVAKYVNNKQNYAIMKWDTIIYRDEVITKLEEVVLTIVQDLSEEKPPSLKYNCRNSWKNTRLETSA